MYLPELSLHPADLAEHLPEPREQVRHVEAAGQPDDALDGVLEHGHVGPHLPERRPRDGPAADVVDHPAHVHRLAGGRRGADGLNLPPHLLLADVLEGQDPLGAEHLVDAELADPAPVVAGGGEDDVGPAVAADAADEEPWAVGEVGVLHLEHLTGELPRGDHHQRHRRADHERHDGPVHGRQVAQAAVHQRVHHVVHAPDHRQRARPRRAAPGAAAEAEELEDGHGQERQQDGVVRGVVHACCGSKGLGR